MLILGFGLVDWKPGSACGRDIAVQYYVPGVYVKEVNELNEASMKKTEVYKRHSRMDNSLNIDWGYALNGRRDGLVYKGWYNLGPRRVTSDRIGSVMYLPGYQRNVSSRVRSGPESKSITAPTDD